MDGEIAESELDRVEMLCPNCLAANDEHAHFCQSCFTPLTAIAASDPLGQVYATGNTYRKAMSRPRSPAILIGMWLIFAPMLLGGVVGLLVEGAALFEPGYDPTTSSTVGTVLIVLLAMGFSGGQTAIASIILYRTTRNFRGESPVVVNDDDEAESATHAI